MWSLFSDVNSFDDGERMEYIMLYRENSMTAGERGTCSYLHRIQLLLR